MPGIKTQPTDPVQPATRAFPRRRGNSNRPIRQQFDRTGASLLGGANGPRNVATGHRQPRYAYRHDPHDERHRHRYAYRQADVAETIATELHPFRFARSKGPPVLHRWGRGSPPVGAAGGAGSSGFGRPGATSLRVCAAALKTACGRYSHWRPLRGAWSGDGSRCLTRRIISSTLRHETVRRFTQLSTGRAVSPRPTPTSAAPS
jgi:hypothetical protein